MILGHDTETRDHCYKKTSGPSPPAPPPSPPPSPAPESGMTLPIHLTGGMSVLATGPGLQNDMLGDYHGTPPVHIVSTVLTRFSLLTHSDRFPRVEIRSLRTAFAPSSRPTSYRSSPAVRSTATTRHRSAPPSPLPRPRTSSSSSSGSTEPSCVVRLVAPAGWPDTLRSCVGE